MTVSELFENYWVVTFALAAAFYATAKFFGEHHLREEDKKHLTRWLAGESEETWSNQFCRYFDVVFGKKHFSRKRIIRSSIASIFAVLVVFILLERILGGLESRMTGNFPLYIALGLGIFINIIPDFVSLYETRWVLGKFKDVDTFFGQLAVLLADLVFTGLIILMSLGLFHYVIGERALEPGELIGLFSVYSIFFYSTFLTSIWAWIYCITTWGMRLFSRVGLARLLPIEEKPMQQIGLCGSATIMIVGLSVPVLFPEEAAGAKTLDTWLCEVFKGQVCVEVDRAGSADSEYLAEVLWESCFSNSLADDCVRAAIIEAKAACEEEEPRGCALYAQALVRGTHIDPNRQRALMLLTEACGQNDAVGCLHLALEMKNSSLGPEETEELFKLIERACSGEEAIGCVDAGVAYLEGTWEQEANPATAASYFQKACDQKRKVGCRELGKLNVVGTDGKPEPMKAANNFKLACEQNDKEACEYLEATYGIWKKSVKNGDVSPELFRLGCDQGHEFGCFEYGKALFHGEGIERSRPDAANYFNAACNNDESHACRFLGAMLLTGNGVSQDVLQARRLLIDSSIDAGPEPYFLLIGCEGDLQNDKGDRSNEELLADFFSQQSTGEIETCEELRQLLSQTMLAK